MTQDLIVLDGWSITVPSSADAARQDMLDRLDAADYDGDIPVNALGQSIATDMSQALGQAKLFMAEVERVSSELRKPYFDHSKKIKATSDTFLMPVAEKVAALGRRLAEHEAEKRRIEIELERQRQVEAARLRREEEEKQRQAEQERQRQEQAERDRLAAIEAAAAKEANAKRRAEFEARAAAERERQAQAEQQREQQRQAEQQQLAVIDGGGARYEAPKTDGVSVKVAYEFDVESPQRLAEWCWKTGRPHWIRMLEFAKRDITEYLNTDGADRSIPGLRVYQAIGATVRKARTMKTINVQSVKVEL